MATDLVLCEVAKVQTLKIDFVVKKWQNEKNSFGILISA